MALFLGQLRVFVCFRTTFSEFASKHAKDQRFKAIDKMKDREAIFIEFMTSLKKKEKEDSKNRGEKVSAGLETSMATENWTSSYLPGWCA